MFSEYELQRKGDSIFLHLFVKIFQNQRYEEK